MRIPKFREYLILYNISKKVIIDSLPQAKFIRVPQNNFLFYQGSLSGEFFLIVSGKISFRIVNLKKGLSKDDSKDFNYKDFKRSKTKKSISPAKKRLSFLKSDVQFDTVEKNTLSEGQFFGEWGLIYGIPRTISAFAVTDAVVLSFSKKVFSECFYRNILRVESDIKDFILKKISSFTFLSKKDFEVYYREVKKKFPRMYEEIFNEGEKAESFYLIYRGKCALRKKGTSHNILMLDKGAIVGLDSLTHTKAYSYTVVSLSEETVVFKFDIRDYNDFFISSLKTELLPNHERQNKTIMEFQARHLKYKRQLDGLYKNLSGKVKFYSSSLINANNINNSYFPLLPKEKKRTNLLRLTKRFQLNFDLKTNTSCSSEKKLIQRRSVIEQVDTEPSSKIYLHKKVPTEDLEDSPLQIKTKYKEYRRLRAGFTNDSENRFFSTELETPFSSQSKRKEIFSSNCKKRSIAKIGSRNISNTVSEWKRVVSLKKNGKFKTEHFRIPLYILCTKDNNE